jgi:hypothetical protein
MVRRSVIPQALNGQPFETSFARAVGLSWKTLQGSHFRRITHGVYVATATADSAHLRVPGVMLALPPDAIVTGVTGLQLLGIDLGSELPMTFASTHPRQIRRRDVRVMRLKDLPPHRDGSGSTRLESPGYASARFSPATDPRMQPDHRRRSGAYRPRRPGLSDIQVDHRIRGQSAPHRSPSVECRYRPP